MRTTSSVRFLVGALGVCASLWLSACSSGGDGAGTGSGGSKATGGPDAGGPDAGGTGGAGGTGSPGTGGAGSPGTGGAGPGGSPGALTAYKTCTSANRVGSFRVTINNDAENPFSNSDGVVLDGVEPVSITREVAKVGECVVLQPPNAANCNPQCAAGDWCTDQGCKPSPNARDVGKVTIAGLKQALALENMANRYVLPLSITLMHPAFSEGADISLTASGAAGYGPFTLKGQGVAALEASKDPVVVESGKAVTLKWNPPGKTSTVTRVHIKFAINIHGAVDTWFECEVPDTGSYTVSGALMTELFKHGVSGFPSVDLTRRSSDTVMVPSGCVEFMVAAPISRPLEVPGIVSCQDDDDCTAPKKCADDLVCR